MAEPRVNGLWAVGSKVADPLAEAAMYMDEDAVAALLAQGADANAVYGGRSALGWAAQTDALGIDPEALDDARKAVEDAAPMITTGVLAAASPVLALRIS